MQTVQTVDAVAVNCDIMKIKSFNNKELKDLTDNDKLEESLHDYDKSEMDNPNEAITKFDSNLFRQLEEMALSEGAVSIGFCKITDDLILNDYNITYRNAIVLIHPLDMRIIESDLGVIAQTYNDYLYDRIAGLTYKMSDFLRNNNVATEVFHPKHDEYLAYSKVAELANLGKIGDSGLLITPQLGPRIKISVILTSIEDLPYPNENDYQWMNEYCDSCKACKKACKQNALSDDCLDTELCIGCSQGCSYCISACPFYKKGYDHVKKIFEKLESKRKNKVEV